MSKIISKLSVIFLGVILTGCVVIINNGKPTSDEQTLMNIQGQASQEVSQINQKIQSGNYSLGQIQGLVDEAKKVVDDNLQKINSLNIPQRTQDLATKTKEYLQKAQQTFAAFLEMSNQGNQKLQDLMSNLQTMSQPLLNMAQQLDAMKNQFMTQLQQAGAAASQQTM